jgi:ferric-dicitrate binding protein FerR (iron transport regulator)
MADTSLEYYIDRYRSGQLTPEEAIALQQLLNNADSQAALDTLQQAQLAEWERSDLQFPEVTARIRNAVQQQIATETRSGAVVRRIGFFTPVWRRYAAAVLLVLLVGAYLWRTGTRKNESTLAGINKVQQKDIAPGREGAVLTLADGRQVLLDSAGNGIVATQNGTKVVLENGRLTYASGEATAQQAVYNTMSTPKGRQFHVVLPDGSKVWLNAATIIKYPAVFNGKERVVELTGEAYFEVAHNPAMPFKIRTGKGTQIEVLGTSFNINAYENEEAVKTTLLEGAVMVVADQQRKLLEPGEQAQVNGNGKIVLFNQADLAQVMAWKNGYFDFNNADLRVMMRQLERWYDIQVQYEGDIPDLVFKGKMDRNVSLSEVMHFLKRYGIKTKLEERTLLIDGI